MLLPLCPPGEYEVTLYLAVIVPLIVIIMIISLLTALFFINKKRYAPSLPFMAFPRANNLWCETSRHGRRPLSIDSRV